MQLYVANCTKQVHDFVYRIPEEQGVKKQKIDPGAQAKIFRDDLTSPAIDNIVAQHRMYGLVAVDEIDRTRPFIGLCYSIGKPVPMTKIGHAMDHNTAVLTVQGAELRKTAAVVTNNTILEQTNSPLQAFEMSVLEDEGKGGDDGHKMIAETIAVRPDPGEDSRPPARRRRKA